MSNILQRAILEIDARLAAIEEAFGEQDWQSPKAYEAFNARQMAYRGIVDDLVARECAKAGCSNDTYTLSLGGIRVSCTAGHHNLLLAWVRKARAKVAEASAEKAGAA